MTDTSGVKPWTIVNKAPAITGNTTGSRSVSNLLAEWVNIEKALIVGSQSETRTYEELWNKQLTVNAYIPTLLSHDVTLGHHINSVTSASCPSPSDLESNPSWISNFTLIDDSTDTSGYLSWDQTPDQAVAATLIVRFGDPYWIIADTDVSSVPVINPFPREESSAEMLLGGNPGAIISRFTDFTLLLNNAAAATLGPVQDVIVGYKVIGTRVASITEADLTTVLA